MKLKKIAKLLKNTFFDINIFETRVYIITDKKLYSKIGPLLKIDINTEDADGLCTSLEKNGKRIIYIGQFTDRDDVLIHECVHASLYILGRIEEEAHYDSELQPYLVQTLFRECKKIIN